MGGDELAVLNAGSATKFLQGTPISFVKDFSPNWVIKRASFEGRNSEADEEEEMTEDVEQTDEEKDDDPLRLTVQTGSVGRVRENFDDDCILLDIDGFDDLICVEPENFHRIRVDELEERLADFRSRLAKELGVMDCDLKFVLPDGHLLSEEEDATPLSTLFAAALH